MLKPEFFLKKKSSTSWLLMSWFQACITYMVHILLWFNIVLLYPNPTCMMTSSNGNNFHVTGPLCEESISHRWIPHTNASNAELWCFLWFECHSAHYDVIVMLHHWHQGNHHKIVLVPPKQPRRICINVSHKSKLQKHNINTTQQSHLHTLWDILYRLIWLLHQSLFAMAVSLWSIDRLFPDIKQGVIEYR